MSLSQHIHDFFFGTHRDTEREAAVRKEWREAIHDSRNASQASIAAARFSKKASDEALRIAQCAITRLERRWDDTEK